MLLKIKFLLPVFVFSVIHCSVFSQKSEFDKNIDSNFQRATELFENNKFAAARKFFTAYIEENTSTLSSKKSMAEYYQVLCAIELNHSDASILAYRFIANNPENPLINQIYFRLGNFEYNAKHYKPATEHFIKVNKDNLKSDEKNEYLFKLGYCYYMTNYIDESRNLLFEVKDLDNRFSPAALYYYSHIAYLQKNYETALEGFLKLQTDETFSKLVPYYISQCYFYQEKYDELLAYAPPLMDSIVETRKSEMARLIADAYYKKNMFKEALPYLEIFSTDTKVVLTNEDRYQLGYCYYKTNQFEKAIKQFERTAVSNNQLAQNSAYMLGDCFIKINDKNKARMAFSQASKLNHDSLVKEDALYNYAVVTYELSFQPFNEAIKALTEYLEKYPNSRRADDAYNFLVNVYLNTRNYSDALTYIDKIKVKDNNLKKAYQKVAFFRGLELFNTLKFDEAISKFEMSLVYSDFDKILKARTYYWLGESYFRIDQIEQAVINFGLFINQPEAILSGEYQTAFYNLGYCAFKEKDYIKAEQWLQRFISLANAKKSNLVADAYNRLGDCYFVKSDYNKSLDYYSRSIDLGNSSKDYAMFQKAICFGLQGKHNDKIAILNQLIGESPSSNYCDDAYFETGKSYVAIQNEPQAIKFFKKIIAEYPQSSYIAKTYLQLGLIYFNNEKNQEAIAQYKYVIENYKGSAESKSALTGLKNIYVSINEIETYINYTAQLGDFANISLAEQDSLNYFAAEKVYMSGDCDKSLVSMAKYLETFKEGSFVNSAMYYKAQCELKKEIFDKALETLAVLLEKPNNTFTEPALMLSIKVKSKSGADSLLLPDFQKLEGISESIENKQVALVGLMKSYYRMSNLSDAIIYADKVKKIENVSAEIMRNARQIKSKSLIMQRKTDEAMPELNELAKDTRSVEGAEARYQIAQLLYNQNKHTEAEKAIFDFAETNSPHQYWVAKSFILLSDIYIAKKDNYQAISTLQSILDNYENKSDGIVDQASQILKDVQKLKN